jgi:beta-glucanase (GH16 family)
MGKAFVVITLILALSSAFLTFPLHAEAKEGWHLVWADEFDYTGLPNPSKWSFETEGNAWGWGNKEEQYYTENRLENAKVGDGVLKIIARKENYAAGFDYTSARIRTKGKADWLYGRFEMSAKLPSGKSIWPAFWMMPVDTYYGPWPACGEIDIMEFFGFIPNKAHFSIHTKKYNHKIGTHKTKQVVNGTLNDTFHVYAVEWFPNRLDFYLDGHKVFTFRKKRNVPDVWPFDRRFYLILNNAVGGEFYRSMVHGIDKTVFPQEYIIDYVRVYQWNDNAPHSLSASAGTGGKVEVTPVKEKYDPAENVTLTAKPDPGFRFDYWSGDLAGSNPVRSFPLLLDTDAKANFLPENELIANGGFDYNLDHWNLWVDPNAAQVDQFNVDQGAVKIKIRKAGQYDWQVQFSQPLAYKEGRLYRLSFNARSEQTHRIRVSFNQNHQPYTSYGAKSFTLTPEWQTFTLETKMDFPSDAQSRLEFDLGSKKGTIWLDEISLIEE